MLASTPYRAANSITALYRPMARLRTSASADIKNMFSASPITPDETPEITIPAAFTFFSSATASNFEGSCVCSSTPSYPILPSFGKMTSGSPTHEIGMRATSGVVIMYASFTPSLPFASDRRS
jgi:hypothetical protein